MNTLSLGLILSVSLLAATSSVSLAGSNGQNNGKPFQELQIAVETAIASEGTAREAEDAALAAAIAAEAAARIAADSLLEAEIASQALLIMGLEGRISVLEGLDTTRSVTWTDTAGPDITGLAGAIAGLNYQSGEWVAIVSRSALTGLEIGHCTNDSRIADWLSAAASGTVYVSAPMGGNDSYYRYGGTWLPNAAIGLRTGPVGGAPYLQTYNATPYFVHQVRDWTNNQAFLITEVLSQVTTNASPGRYGLGNTLTLNVGLTPQEACGVFFP